MTKSTYVRVSILLASLAALWAAAGAPTLDSI